MIPKQLCNDSNDMVIPGKFHQKNCLSKLNLRKKNLRFLKGASGSVSKSENDHFGTSDGIFLLSWKKKLIIFFLGWNFPEITVMLQSLQHYFGITVKIRKNRIFHRFFNFRSWSRNNAFLHFLWWITYAKCRYYNGLNIHRWKKYSRVQYSLTIYKYLV